MIADTCEAQTAPGSVMYAMPSFSAHAIWLVYSVVVVELVAVDVPVDVAVVDVVGVVEVGLVVSLVVRVVVPDVVAVVVAVSVAVDVTVVVGVLSAQAAKLPSCAAWIASLTRATDAPQPLSSRMKPPAVHPNSMPASGL